MQDYGIVILVDVDVRENLMDTDERRPLMAVSTVLILIWLAVFAAFIVSISMRFVAYAVIFFGFFMVWTWVVLSLGTLDPVLDAAASQNGLVAGSLVLLVGVGLLVLTRRENIFPAGKGGKSTRASRSRSG